MHDCYRILQRLHHSFILDVFFSPRLKHYNNLQQALTSASLGTAYGRLLTFYYRKRTECCCCFHFYGTGEFACACARACLTQSPQCRPPRASFVKRRHSFSLCNLSTSLLLPLSSFYLPWPLSIFQTAPPSLAHSTTANPRRCHHPVPGH